MVFRRLGRAEAEAWKGVEVAVADTKVVRSG